LGLTYWIKYRASLNPFDYVPVTHTINILNNATPDGPYKAPDYSQLNALVASAWDLDLFIAILTITGSEKKEDCLLWFLGGVILGLLPLGVLQ
jgi:hypothetical protein